MTVETETWYRCEVCGELRRYPFDRYMDDPGCRCPVKQKAAPCGGEDCCCASAKTR